MGRLCREWPGVGVAGTGGSLPGFPGKERVSQGMGCAQTQASVAKFSSGQFVIKPSQSHGPPGHAVARGWAGQGATWLWGLAHQQGKCAQRLPSFHVSVPHMHTTSRTLSVSPSGRKGLDTHNPAPHECCNVPMAPSSPSASPTC